ncbi:chemotaxis protein [uncultured Ilyobacter sp.]|uniref:chemotaxis protein n=1 Tax=uncultured Ilyobacter sp. TaxID=544433 RepID=UPI0029C020EF|nr:chemotaxis protein [uncultured Ilyobacter sp.]
MDILIDNKKIDFEKKDFETLGLVIEEVNRLLEKEGKMLYNIYVNGQLLAENNMVGGEKIKVVEILTKSPKSIILEAISDMEVYIEKYFETIDLLDLEMEVENDLRMISVSFEVVAGLDWIYNILMSIKENTALDLLYEDFDAIIEDYEGCMSNISQAMESKDTYTLQEILEYEMSDLLMELKENIEGYYENILKEEMRDRKFA